MGLETMPLKNTQDIIHHTHNIKHMLFPFLRSASRGIIIFSVSVEQQNLQERQYNKRKGLTGGQ